MTNRLRSASQTAEQPAQNQRLVDTRMQKASFEENLKRYSCGTVEMTSRSVCCRNSQWVFREGLWETLRQKKFHHSMEAEVTVAAGPGIGCGQSDSEPKIAKIDRFSITTTKNLDFGGNPPHPRAKPGTKLSGRAMRIVCCTRIGMAPSHLGDMLIYR